MDANLALRSRYTMCRPDSCEIDVPIPSPCADPVLPILDQAAIDRQLHWIGRRIAAGGYPLQAAVIAQAIIDLDEARFGGRRAIADSVRRSLVAVVRDAIDRLPTRMGLLLQLTLIEQLSDQSIGCVAGVSTVTVSEHRRATFRQLANSLADG